jgi:hypothetical protein
VTPKTRAWLLILAVFGVCGLLLWGAISYRSRLLSPAAMLKRLPTDNAVVVYIDFEQLRRHHILELFDNAKVGQDPEYQAFIERTDFNYRQDLDTALVSFGPTGKYMLLRGRFDWKALKAYVIGQDGRCLNAVCKMVGSAPDRHISFFPLQQNVMALAVSPGESAAERLNAVDQRSGPELPDAPLWILVPGSVLKTGGNLPAGTQKFVESMAGAEMLTLWLAPEGQALSAKLNIRCTTVSAAAEMASQLTKLTALLRRLIESEHQTPNPADFSGMLTAGTFHNEGARVVGSWPIPQALIQNLFSGN